MGLIRTVATIGAIVSILFVAPLLAADKEAPLSGLNLENFQKPDDNIKWEDNPFVQAAENSVGGLKLFAIVYNPTDAAALINRQIVRVGEKVGNAEILSIREKEVILRTDSGIFKLSFDGRKN